MARYGSLTPSAAGAASAATTATKATQPPATPKPAGASAQTQQKTVTESRAPAGPAKPKTPAPKTPKSPYSAESEAIFGSKPGTLSIEERFSPGQAESLRAAGLLGPADTAALDTSMADTDFYLKKLQAVEALRKQGVLGTEVRRPPTGGAGEVRTYGTPGRTVIRSTEIPMMVSLRSGEPATSVMPDPRYVYTPGSEMDTIARFREMALELGKSYRDDAEAVRQGSDGLARAGRDPLLNRSLLRGMEQDQLQRIRRLAASRASLREMGFMDDQEVQEKFLK
jgi:hypothetical protein